MGMYTFPGGKIEDNQTTEEALIKEVAEEAGLTLKPGKILLKDKAFIRPDGQTSKVFSYLCEVEDDSVVTINEEFTDYKWVSREDLKDIPHVGIDEELRKADELYAASIDLTLLRTKSVRVD